MRRTGVWKYECGSWGMRRTGVWRYECGDMSVEVGDEEDRSVEV